MRQVRYLPGFFVLAAVAAPALWAQGDAGLSIANYQLVDAQRYTRTQWYETYRAELLNTGVARAAITATVTSLSPGMTVVPGRGTLHFGPIPANGRATSSDTFTVFIDYSQASDLSALRWSFLNPVANAGPDQSVSVGTTVHLNGGASSNPTGVGTLTYQWSFETRPKESAAVIQNSTSPVGATFVVDVPGEYKVLLLVRNGSGQDTDRMIVTTGNSRPVARAGPNQSVPLGANVVLNGGGSSDVDGDNLNYFWTMVSQPAGSRAFITAFRSVIAFFTPDVPGTYVAQLVVNDGRGESLPSLVTISTGGAANTPPVANAGPNQSVPAGTTVQLDGSASSDVNSDPLTYQWALINKPNGSAAQLSSTSAVNPTFVADVPGPYIAQLVVNDGQVDSAPSTVVITTNAAQNGIPTANAGPGQTVGHGQTVQLDGSGTDPQSLPLTYEWSLITKPAGSGAALSDPTIPNPTFVADKPGTYVAQLQVSNGTESSVPSTVTITTTNTAPVANAGAPQTVPAGFLVNLDGSASSDADNDPLSYTWSFTTRPPGSAAALSAASSATPTFTPDLPGTYVVQLIVNDGFTSSVPATVTITAVGSKIVLSPDPLNLVNAAGTLKVMVNPPAGPSGATITFFGFDPSIISVPPTADIPAGANSVDVPISPVAPGSTYLYAGGAGYQPGTATINVTLPSVSVSLGGGGVATGRSLTGKVQLSAPAPAGGTSVTLVSSPGGRVTFDPAVVVVAEGATTGAFTLTGAAAGPATVSVTAPGYQSGGSAALLVVATLGAIMMEPEISVEAEKSVLIVVQLSSPAPAGGVTVSLVSNDPNTALVAPDTVFIPQGATVPAVPPSVAGVAAGTTSITATAQNYLGANQTVTVTPKPPVATVLAVERKGSQSGDL